MGLFGNWHRTRTLRRTLSEALELEREKLGAEQADFVAEYLLHGEFGLAHDQIVDALSDREITPTLRTQILLAAANRLMSRGN